MGRSETYTSTIDRYDIGYRYGVHVQLSYERTNNLLSLGFHNGFTGVHDVLRPHCTLGSSSHITLITNQWSCDGPQQQMCNFLRLLECGLVSRGPDPSCDNSMYMMLALVSYMTCAHVIPSKPGDSSTVAQHATPKSGMNLYQASYRQNLLLNKIATGSLSQDLSSRCSITMVTYL